MSALPTTVAPPSAAAFAKAYAERYGFHIVPLPPLKKRPLKKQWGIDVLSDPQALHDYFTEHPDWNMGVVLGPSRICSFDVDDFDATRMIFAEFGWDFDALFSGPTIQGSPSGCRFMFAIPEGVELGYQKLEWPRKDDASKRYTVWELRGPAKVKADPGEEAQRQDVLPPSIHPETGKPYVWLTKPNGHFPFPPDLLLRIWQHLEPLEAQFKSVCPWAPKELPKPAREPRPLAEGQASVIDAYNAAHDIESDLNRYGYTRQGRRYLSPHSGTGLPGVTVFDNNRCWIHHASDPLCSNDKGQPVSPFDLFRYYEHGDDYNKAVKQASADLGMKYTRHTPEPKPVKTVERVDPDTGEITHEPAPENEPLDLFAEFPAPTLQRGMLPDAIFDYAAECSELIGASPEMIAVPALVACAAALHDGVKIQPKRFEPEWTESARLWCAIVGSPSVKKTPSISRATKRLRGINATLAEENSRVQAKFDEQCDQYKKDKKIADKTGDFVQAPEKPKLKRLLVEDITIEALSEILKDNDRGILCIQDELSGWFGSMDAYSSGKSGNKDRAAWLQAYNGGHRQVDRIMRGAVHVPNFSVSMIGGIQPDAIRRLAAQMPEDGLMQRFMIVIGTENQESDRIKDSEAFNRYGALVDHLYAITPAEKPVKLTEAAHIVREHLNAYASDLIKYSSLPGALKAAIGKWSGLFARLTLLFHAIDCRDKSVHPVNCEVSGDTAARVSKFIRLFLLPHSIAYYTDILNAGTEIENARWIAGYILSRKLTDIDNREITRAYNAWRGFDKWRRQRVMAILEDAGWVTPVAQIGQPVIDWTVNPRVHELFSERAESAKERRDGIRENLQALQERRFDDVDFDRLRVQGDRLRD